MGKITVVGLGPGNLLDMTRRAKTAIQNADVVVGYNTYVKLIETLLKGKRVIGTGMMQEVDRCRIAAETAAEGFDVIVVSGGDAGIYGMAGLVLEIILDMEPTERPEFGGVIAGVSAVGSAAAVLGAPLMHDFAIISLSDLLTSWETIKKRARLAAEADFVIALYNPKSQGRVEHIEEIKNIILEHRAPETPVGIVTNASRENQSRKLSNLQDFTQEEIGMSSLVIIGNSQTYIKDGYMITPRGYSVRGVNEA